MRGNSSDGPGPEDLERRILSALKAPGRTGAQDRGAVWRRSEHGAAHKPPFRERKRGRLKRQR